MKILWISHLLPFPPKGGVLIRSYNNLKEVSKYHDIFFVGLYQAAHQPDKQSVEIAKKNINMFCKNVTALPFESFQNKLEFFLLVFRSFFTFKSYKEAWCKSKKMATTIKGLLEKESFDLVHFDTISLLQYYNLIPSTIPIAINHHNIESQMMLRRFFSEKKWLVKVYCYLEGLKLQNLEKKYCNKGINLVVSGLDRDRLKKKVPSSRIAIVPNGVDINYFRKMNVKESKNSIIFIGGLTWYPNIYAMEYFCSKVWPLLVKEVEDVQLFIVGRNPSEFLKELSREDKRIQLKGFVEDIRPITSRSTCYVCPMRTGGGTRLKVLDALAMGIPLVATKMACEGINVKDNESVLFAETSKDFVEKIVMLFNQKELRDKLSKNSRELIENEFDYEKIGFKLSQCYKNELKRIASDFL